MLLMQAPQSVVVELTFRPPPSPTATADGAPSSSEPVKVYLGWSGFPSQVGSVSVGRNGGGSGMSEIVEVDPQVGAVMGLGPEGSQVSTNRAGLGPPSRAAVLIRRNAGAGINRAAA